MHDMISQLDAACDAACEAGRILLSFLGKVTVREKGRSDLVTDADLAAQQTIQRILNGRFPEYAFLGEESSQDEQANARQSGKPIWIVDPLDGTTNFVHKMPGFCVSIALVIDDVVQLGVVHDPVQNATYSSARNGPTLRDGKPIEVSGCDALERALVCCSLSPGIRRNDPSVGQFLNVLEASRSVRRLGSAALNLCYVAEGCLDSYWTSSVKCWDVAAGYLIALQAGAVVSRIDGSRFNLWEPELLCSSSLQLQQQMRDCMKIAESH